MLPMLPPTISGVPDARISSLGSGNGHSGHDHGNGHNGHDHGAVAALGPGGHE
jgi:hypothetical protein